MRERIQAFDEEAEKATQEKLDQIRSSLNEEMQKSLADLQKATEDSVLERQAGIVMSNYSN